MKFVRFFLIFCYGLFTIAAQTLLFREFLTTFEGSEFSVGMFFASWFFWIALGAVIIYRPFKIIEALQKHIDLLFLAYIPAFVLELILIIQARHIAGISSYTLWSMGQMAFMSLIVNAPVSIITGLFFPLACRWIQQNSRLPVSNVYMVEAAGGFAGGIAVTILLEFGVNSITIFLLLAFWVSLAVWIVRFAGKKRYMVVLTLIIPLGILCCLGFGLDKSLARYIQVVKWTKLLPAEALAGSFQTAQAEYLYGTYGGQWLVVREGSTCEVLPNKTSTGRIAAIVLAQKPDAKKILVIGSGLGLCYDFLLLPQIEKVSWTHCDNQYVQQVTHFLPDSFKISDSRLEYLPGDIRSELTSKTGIYDIVIVNLPDATNSVLNRYFTEEFYRRLKNSMTTNGLAAVRVTGGENIMGTELIDLGASTRHTLKQVFSNLVLVPGDNTWFIVSDSGRLNGSPRGMERRFAGIKNIEAVFTPSALSSVYLPERAASAMDAYDSTDLPAHLLISKDSRPLASLYNLLLAWKQSGSPVTKIVKLLTVAQVTVFLVPIVVYVILRMFYMAGTKNQDGVSSFDSSFLVFSAGWLGIGIVIVLMYLYQTQFGSLYLHIGVISSLFMMGLTVGSALFQYLLVKDIFNKGLTFAAILIHTVLLGVIIYLPADFWMQVHFAVVFFLCGLCNGAYFPIAAKQLAAGGFETGLSGGKLETADHIGASAGSLITGIALVPMLGTKGTIWVFIALIAANLPAVLWKAFGKQTPSVLPFLNFRRAGYLLFGIAASVIICSNYLAYVAANQVPFLSAQTAQLLAGQSSIEYAQADIPDSEKKIPYFKIYGIDKQLSGYIFFTRNLAPDVRGFGGKINLAVHIDTSGTLLNYYIMQANETPSYLQRLANWHQGLIGRQLFNVKPFEGIKPVTGATISSRAILSAIELSGKKFAQEVLIKSGHVEPGEKSTLSAFMSDRSTLYLLIAAGLSIFVIFRGDFWARLAVLIFNVVIGGFILNIQYSTDQMISILSGQNYTPQLTGIFLLMMGVPLLIFFFGNIYCGYLCPFGALQELLGYIIPDKWKLPLSREAMRKARFIKYIILFVLVMAVFLSHSKSVLISDPLVSFFNLKESDFSLKNMVFIIILLALIGSVFYRRFWCRYLCPTGAFLSLLNNLIIFKRLNTPKGFARCEFGISAKDKMDCIYCDRCRHSLRAAVPVKEVSRLAAGLSGFLVFWVLITAILVSAVCLNQFSRAFPSPKMYSAPLPTALPSSPPSSTTPLSTPTSSVSTSETPSYGQPRDIDMQKIHTQIDEKKLSDKEAQFYERVD